MSDRWRGPHPALMPALQLTEVYQIESDFKAKVESAFDEMIARAGGVPPALFA